MKMKQISDTTLKITMSLEDLMDRGMEIADFLVPQEKTEEFFYAILDELEMPDSFLDTGMLSFRVTPKPDKVDVFVTKSKIDQNLDFEDLADLPDMDELAKMSPDEFLKTLEKTMAEKTKDDIEAIQSLEQVEKEEEAVLDEALEAEEGKREPYIYYILRFDDLADLPDMDELAKMSPDEFLKTLEKTMAEKTKDDIEAIQSLEQVEKEEEAALDEALGVEEGKREPYIYYILRFDNLASLVSFAKMVDYQMETSELYKMNDQYYLTVLVDVEDRPNLYPAWLLARMREFADDSDISRSVLQEYGQVLINHDAVQGLQKV